VAAVIDPGVALFERVGEKHIAQAARGAVGHRDDKFHHFAGPHHGVRGQFGDLEISAANEDAVGADVVIQNVAALFVGMLVQGGHCRRVDDHPAAVLRVNRRGGDRHLVTNVWIHITEITVEHAAGDGAEFAVFRPGQVGGQRVGEGCAPGDIIPGAGDRYGKAGLIAREDGGVIGALDHAHVHAAVDEDVGGGDEFLAQAISGDAGFVNQRAAQLGSGRRGDVDLHLLPGGQAGEGAGHQVVGVDAAFFAIFGPGGAIGELVEHLHVGGGKIAGVAHGDHKADLGAGGHAGDVGLFFDHQIGTVHVDGGRIAVIRRVGFVLVAAINGDFVDDLHVADIIGHDRRDRNAARLVGGQGAKITGQHAVGNGAQAAVAGGVDLPGQRFGVGQRVVERHVGGVARAVIDHRHQEARPLAGVDGVGLGGLGHLQVRLAQDGHVSPVRADPRAVVFPGPDLVLDRAAHLHGGHAGDVNRQALAHPQAVEETGHIRPVPTAVHGIVRVPGGGLGQVGVVDVDVLQLAVAGVGDRDGEADRVAGLYHLLIGGLGDHQVG